MKTDVVILGAGPVGLFSAFYTSLRGMNSIVIDQLSHPGGQLMALYPEKYIYDVAGFDKIKAKDLIDNLKKQLNRFENNYDLLLGSQILSIQKQDDGRFIVKTNENTIDCGSVIIAGGNGGFSPRKLGVENEENFNIDYFIEDPNNYKDKDVIIFGGGDSAVDFALMLDKVAKSVNIVHRRDEFRAHEGSVNDLKNSKVVINTPYTPLSITQEGSKYKVTIKSKENTKDIIVDNIICNFGFISKLGPIEDFGLNIEKNKIVVNSEQKTNIEGVYAIGDICTYPGKANLIISGFGEAPIAVNQAFVYQNPDKKLTTLHSSSIIK